ncbi:MAG: hypothetical protein NTX25_19510 [Proteobacteria bacterium]|nr:hypothetical protein [Pseudomonadota bacterium]
MLLANSLVLGSLLSAGVAMANIQGLYQSDCQKTPDQNLSAQLNVNFGQKNARQVQIIYGDAECQQQAYALDYRGPYTLDTDGSLNLVLSTLQLTPLDARIVQSFNQAKLCGYTNWALNAAKNVAGLDCGGTPIPQSGTVSYDRVKEVEGGIVFGELTEAKDGSTVAKRPVGYSDVVFKAVVSQ